MRLLRACAVGATCLLWHVPALAAPPAAPVATDAVTAREQLKIGYTLAQEDKCGEAIPHLAESLRLDPRPITLINLADCEEKVGKLSNALVHWVDARARAHAEGQRPIEEEAAARAAAVEGRLSRLTIVLGKTAPSAAVVERDGVALGAPSLGMALPVDPGTHTIVVKAKGRADATQKLTLVEGEKQTIEVEAGAIAPVAATPPPPDDASRGSTTSPLVFGGLGLAAAGLAIGAVTGILALGKGSDAETNCPGGRCTNAAALDDVEAGRTLGTVSTIAFIAGGVGAAVGLYGLVWGGTKKETQSGVAVAISPSALLLRGRF